MAIVSSTLPSYIIVDPDIVADGMNALNLSIQDNLITDIDKSIFELFRINLGILTPGEVKVVSFNAVVNYDYPNPIYSQAKVFYGFDPIFLTPSIYSSDSNILIISID